jgi:hypothetical protein
MDGSTSRPVVAAATKQKLIVLIPSVRETDVARAHVPHARASLPFRVRSLE